jgi:hypothetical protein
VLHVSFACEVFLDHPQKKFGFLGEVANHLRLGLVIKQKSKKEKLGLIKTKLD